CTVPMPYSQAVPFVCFFFQAEDGIRDKLVTGVQTCALPICHQACGYVVINGLARATAKRGLGAELLDLRNSGDTAGDKQRVVGYAAFAFTEPPRGGARQLAEKILEPADAG